MLLALIAALLAAGLTAAPPTFHKDVEPILQRRCQNCHRPGEAAPFPLLTYAHARPWAKAIRDAVAARRMPPWFADPRFNKYIADGSLPQSDVVTITEWANNGAPEGDPSAAPAPRVFREGWTIGEPDQVIELPRAFPIPASGRIEYQNFIVPTGFKEDRWIQRAEARPTERSVVHHVVVFVREPGSKWLANAKSGESVEEINGPAVPAGIVTGYSPGTAPTLFPSWQGILIKAGSDLVIQMHYTPSGKAVEDRTRVGLVFHKTPPRERVVTIAPHNRSFTIPPGASNYRVDTSTTFAAEGTLIAVMPHMHLRGQSFEYRVVQPNGESEVLLRVPKYDFNWQLVYGLRQRLHFTPGMRVECTAYFDNSANNPANPDAKKAVTWGDQTFEEMMIGWMYIAIDPTIPPNKLLKESAFVPGT